MGEAIHMEGQGIQEKSVYLFLVFIVNLRLLFKKKVLKQKKEVERKNWEARRNGDLKIGKCG